MIEVQNLRKNYQQTAVVKDVSFTVDQGQTLVLLGTSGSGKTTTLRMINRLVEPTSGTILINGTNVLEQPLETLRRGIGYVLQNNGLFPHYTVAENVGIVPQLLGWDADSIRNRSRELLAKLHLDPSQYFHKYPHQLSGGQQQRVGLARAVAANPPVLLMDEPFGALDAVTRTKIRHEFLQLDELKNKTIVMVTHDVEEAFELGDRIGLMHEGVLRQIGTPAELLFKPADEFTSSFLGNNHLVLALKSTRIRSIWYNLPEFSGNKENGVIDAQITDDLWTLMQRLTKADTEALIIRDGSTEKFLTLQHLLETMKQLGPKRV